MKGALSVWWVEAPPKLRSLSHLLHFTSLAERHLRLQADGLERRHAHTKEVRPNPLKPARFLFSLNTSWYVEWVHMRPVFSLCSSLCFSRFRRSSQSPLQLFVLQERTASIAEYI